MPGGSPQRLRPFLWRAEQLYPDTEIVSRTNEGLVRYDYAEYGDRTAQLANALDAAGYGDGERLGTFCWNTSRHFETYFGVPGIGNRIQVASTNLAVDVVIAYILLLSLVYLVVDTAFRAVQLRVVAWRN